MTGKSLPKEWGSIEYGDALISASNGIGGKQNKDGIGIPLSRIETIASETINFERVGYLEKYDPNKIAKYRICKGDILFSHINSPLHLGKTALFDSDEELYHGINLLRLVVDRKVMNPDFFNYHCKLMRNLGVFSQNAQHAVNQSSLNQKKLFQFSAPLPPLAEQKAIAEKLDTLLAQVESTKARLECIPKILKRFRQSVLAAAVSGKLTEEWRGDKRFNQEQKFFSEIIESAQVGLVRSSKEQESFQLEGHHSPYLKMNNIDNDWGVSIDELVYVRSDESERDRYRLRVGDWLFNTRNSSELVGKSCVWKESGEHLYNNNILRIRLLCGYLPDYLEVWFRSPAGRASLESIKSATTSVAAIYQKQLLKQIVPFPDPKEQTEIVRRVDQLFAYADTIETQVHNALERVNNLTQSILAKAFRGELTEQWRKDNPDLISGENSAEALLEKIKAERVGRKRRSRLPTK